jgi:hypothetical protein
MTIASPSGASPFGHAAAPPISHLYRTTLRRPWQAPGGRRPHKAGWPGVKDGGDEPPIAMRRARATAGTCCCLPDGELC